MNDLRLDHIEVSGRDRSLLVQHLDEPAVVAIFEGSLAQMRQLALAALTEQVLRLLRVGQGGCVGTLSIRPHDAGHAQNGGDQESEPRGAAEHHHHRHMAAHAAQVRDRNAGARAAGRGLST